MKHEEATQVEEQTEVLEAADGWPLFVRWVATPRGRRAPRGCVVAGHAMMVDGRTIFHASRPCVARTLAERGYLVLVPDQRGHGQSGPVPSAGADWSYADLVGDVGVYLGRAAGELDRQGADQAPLFLLGHSLFGHVGLAWLARTVERRRALEAAEWERQSAPSVERTSGVGADRRTRQRRSRSDARWLLRPAERDQAEQESAGPAARQRPGRAAGHAEPGEATYGRVAGFVAIATSLWAKEWTPSDLRWARKTWLLNAARTLVQALGYLPARRLRIGPADEAGGYWMDLDATSRTGIWGPGDVYHRGLGELRLPVLHVLSKGDGLNAQPDDARRFLSRLGPWREELLIGSGGRLDAQLAAGAPDHMGLVTRPSSEPIWLAIADWLDAQLFANGLDL